MDNYSAIFEAQSALVKASRDLAFAIAQTWTEDRPAFEWGTQVVDDLDKRETHLQCVCGNNPSTQGFLPVNSHGDVISGEIGLPEILIDAGLSPEMDEHMVVCMQCGRVIEQSMDHQPFSFIYANPLSVIGVMDTEELRKIDLDDPGIIKASTPSGAEYDVFPAPWQVFAPGTRAEASARSRLTESV